MDAWLQGRGVTLIGGDLDESPMAYRRLSKARAREIALAAGVDPDSRMARRPWTRGMYVLSSPRLTTASPDRKEKMRRVSCLNSSKRA
jgi:hypothetical protein